MSDSVGPAEGQRQQLLEKLRILEEAAAQFQPEKAGADTAEMAARFQDAAKELETHLAKHWASKETADWPELPDSDAEISAYAGELKAEHKYLMGELAQLIRDAGEIHNALDRLEAARHLRQRSRALALRIARHVGGEEARLGNYS